MIVEQRDYHVYTGKLPELVRLYETEGIAIQQEILGGFVGAFTTDIGALSTYTSMWRYESFAEREERRARLQADERWKAFLARIQPLIHTQQNRILDPDLVLAASLMGALDGKVAIVTGGAQGIGAAIADGLAAEGATVVVADLEPARRAASQADVAVRGGRGRGWSRRRSSRHGRIDILVNNAGLYASLAMRPFTEIPLEEWRQVMDVNVASMFLTCRAVVPVMREQGGGKIVNISSGTPFRGVPFLLHYVTSKGAIVAFTRALAKELGKDAIHVNCVAPGFTMSDGRRRRIPRWSRSCATSPSPRARSSATRCPRTSSARSSSSARRPPTSSPARRWSSTAASTSIEPRRSPSIPTASRPRRAAASSTTSSGTRRPSAPRASTAPRSCGS